MNHEHGGPGVYHCDGGTWGALDGHAYERRMRPTEVDKLQREYEGG